MQAYMRSAMPFHGVAAPQVRRVVRTIFSDLRLPSFTAWQQVTRYLWQHARYREERYMTIALARSRAAQPFQTPRALSLYGELIASGAWWDYVDEVAIHCVGPILRAFPGQSHRTLVGWSRSPSIWLRRTSIIAQVGSKGSTDLALLETTIAPSLGSAEFFLRKAIGWALRQEARYDPAWVVRYVRSHERELSTLSQREALRHLAATPERS